MNEFSTALEAAKDLGATNVALIGMTLAVVFHALRQMRGDRDEPPPPPPVCGITEDRLRVVLRDELDKAADRLAGR